MFRCPECKKELEILDYVAYYSQSEYGKSSGTYDLETECSDYSDLDTSETNNFEEDDFTYMCPECNCEVDPDDCEVDEDSIQNPIIKSLLKSR